MIDGKCTEEIDSSNEKLLPSQTRADLLVPGLHRFSWKYIQSEAEDELKTNRTILTGLLRPREPSDYSWKSPLLHQPQLHPHGWKNRDGASGSGHTLGSTRTRRRTAFWTNHSTGNNHRNSTQLNTKEFYTKMAPAKSID